MKIRQLEQADLLKVVSIEKHVWAGEAATKDQIQSRMKVFSKGSIVAELPNGKIVGYAAAQLVNHISTGSWDEQTDQGGIAKTHQPEGLIAYGVGMSVLPEAASYNISGAIIEYYHQEFILNGLCYILCLGSRLPRFSKWKRKNKGTIHDYLTQTRNGYSIDPELRLYEQNGFDLLWHIPEYFPDTESMNYGAMIGRRKNV